MLPETNPPRRLLACAIMCAAIAGCAGLPRIDPSGNRVFVWPKDQPQTAPLLAAPSSVVAPPVVTDAVFPAAPVVAAAPGAIAGPVVTPTSVALAQVPQDRVSITPDRILAPVGSEVVLKASVCTTKGFTLADQQVEWMLGRNGVGQFVEVSGKGWFHPPLLPWNKAKKVDNYLAEGWTAKEPLCITRGTPDPADDVAINPGDAWISVTSPNEGTSYVTAYMPSVETWNTRKSEATIYWVDVQWTFPPPTIPGGGRSATLTTVITRQTNGAPIQGWIVRYELADGGGNLSGAGGGQAVEVQTDAQGRATVVATPTAAGAAGTPVTIQLIRPAGYGGGDAPRLIIGSGSSLIQWGTSTPYLSPRRWRRWRWDADPNHPDDSGRAGQPLHARAVAAERSDHSLLARRYGADHSRWWMDAAGHQRRRPLVPLAPRPTAPTRTDARRRQPGRCRRPGPARVQHPQHRHGACDRRAGGRPHRPWPHVPAESRFARGGIQRRRHDRPRRCEAPSGAVQRHAGRPAVPQRHGASAENVEATATFCVDAAQPRMDRVGRVEVRKEGPVQGVVGQPVKFRVTVKNTGELPLADIRVIDEYPAQFFQIRTQADVVSGVITHTIPRLEVGTSRTFEVECLCLQAALPVLPRPRVRVEAQTDPPTTMVPTGDEVEMEILPARGVGDAGPGIGAATAGPLKVETIFFNRQARVGSKAMCQVTIVNSSTAPDDNVLLRMIFPPQLTPDVNGVQISEPNVTATLTGDQLNFTAVASLPPGQRVTYTIPMAVKGPAAIAEVVTDIRSSRVTTNVPRRDSLEILSQ